MVAFVTDLKLEKKYVLILAAIQFAHIVDFVVLMPLGPTLMLDFKINPTQFGALVSSYNFSAGGAGLVFSAVADRFDRKKLLNLSMAGFILGTLLCGMASSFTLLLWGRIITGVFGGILNILVFSMVADLVPFERRGRAMGTVMASFSVASVLGIPIGLAIADFTSWHWTFYFIATVSLVIAIFGAKILPTLRPTQSGKSFFDVMLRFWQLLNKRDYVRAYSLILMIAISMFLLIPFLSPFAVQNIGIGAHHLKYMYFISGICTVLSARYIGRMTDLHGSLKVFAILAFCSIIPIWLYTHAGHIGLVPYLILSAVFMTVVSGRMIPVMTMVSEVPDAHERGTFMGLLNSIRSFGTASATLVGGLLISQNEVGEIVGFDRLGLMTIGLTLFSVFLGARVYRLSLMKCA